VAFELDGELVGTVRAVPIGYGLTLAEKLREQAGIPPRDTYLNGWEMGRLAISPDWRGGPESLRGFLYLSLSFLHDNISPVGSLHATCTPVLARLYRRFGFTVEGRDVPLPGTAKTYTLIHGYFSHVIAELADGAGEAAHDTAPAAALARFATPPSTTSQGAFA
jgi:hypothetical protein